MAYRPRRKQVRRPRKVVRRKAPMRKKMRVSRPMSLIPFPKVRNCTFVFKQPSIPITSNAINGTIIARFRCNSLYDFDYDNYFLDKQPLFFDQMFSVTGPYKSYKVNAWKTTITVTNLTDAALQVYYDPGIVNSVTDADTISEMQNRQGVQYKLITAQNNAKPQVTFKTFRKLSNYVPSIANQGLDYVGSYNSDPVNVIISSLVMARIDPSVLTTFNATVSVQHTFYTTCYNNDSLAS